VGLISSNPHTAAPAQSSSLLTGEEGDGNSPARQIEIDGKIWYT
jgi:hypothetical protein